MIHKANCPDSRRFLNNGIRRIDTLDNLRNHIWEKMISFGVLFILLGKFLKETWGKKGYKWSGTIMDAVHWTVLSQIGWLSESKWRACRTLFSVYWTVNFHWKPSTLARSVHFRSDLKIQSHFEPWNFRIVYEWIALLGFIGQSKDPLWRSTYGSSSRKTRIYKEGNERLYELL